MVPRRQNVAAVDLRYQDQTRSLDCFGYGRSHAETVSSDEFQSRFSPDGRWITYVSDESGKPEVYAQSFPTLGKKLRISDRGGLAPAWRGDGRELFYTSPDGKLMSTEIRGGATIEAGTPKTLFSMTGAQGFAPTRDGSRFLVVLTDPSADPWPMTLVFNWPALLK